MPNTRQRVYALMRLVACLLIFLTVVSCSRVGPNRVGPGGLQPTIEQLGYGNVAMRQNELVTHLQSMAGLGDQAPGVDDDKWFLILKAGMLLVDGQCDQYLDALFRFNREQSAVQQGLTATAATTAAILGLTGASGKAIAITAATFGLGSVLFEASANTVLFQLEPSAVRNIVREARNAYKEAVFKRAGVYRSRPDAMLGLQGYLGICTPAAIEARVNEAATDRTFIFKENGQAPNPDLQGVSKREAGVSPEMLRSVEERLRTFEANPPPTADAIAAAVEGAVGPVEEVVRKEQLKRVQSALCVKPDGKFGNDSREALVEYRTGMRKRPLSDEEKQAALSAIEREALQAIGSCETSGFQSAFERARLRESIRVSGTTPVDKVESAAILRLQAWVKRLMGPQAPQKLESSIPTDEIRNAIQSKREELGITEGVAGSITSKLWNSMQQSQ